MKLNASAHRDTQYEFKGLRQEPNSFVVTCVERGVWGSQPAELELHEDLFTAEEMQLIHATLRLLEERFALSYAQKEAELQLAGLSVPREIVHELVRQAEEARRAKEQVELETARLEAELVVKRAEQEALEANLAAIRAAVEGQPSEADDKRPT